ncbi:MAG: DUF932 domain-containing protein [Catenulispora sp.]|nr:DUF932 domain-containing protein [Catenulispora sp.]NUT43924.1 DUF932 domain-containing protein [Thermoactinospora sp.]
MTTLATPALETRHADLSSMVGLLAEQYAHRVDLVQPASLIHAKGGLIQLATDTPRVEITEHGVTTLSDLYTPTDVFHEGIADKLGIPVGYVRRMAVEFPELWDQNVNGWLGIDADNAKKYLVRTFPGLDGGPGIARAFLSDRYRVIDNLDVLTAALSGIEASGIKVDITGCDLTERRMYVRFVARDLALPANDFLRDYRAPNGDMGKYNTLVSAGGVITNSELGGGAYAIYPRVVVQVCGNGMTVTKDGTRKVHLGEKLSQGKIDWSADTNSKWLDLVKSMTTDSVAHWLSRDYLSAFINEVTGQAAHRIENPEEAIEIVGKKLRFDDTQRAEILRSFIYGADPTAGGVMQAVTAVAQTQASGDKQAEMESRALEALAIAARL